MTEQFANLTGFDDLKKKLTLLPKNIGRNVLRGAVNAASTVVRQDAVRRAPLYVALAAASGGDKAIAKGHPPAGTLKRSIYQKQIREKSNELKQTFYVSVRHGKTDKNTVDAYYAHMVEWGTVKMGARPFLRPAFEARREAAIEAMRLYLANRIPNEIAKLST